MATVEPAECSGQIHDFKVMVIDIEVHLQTVKMDNSLYLWIGSSENPVLEDLSMALPTNYDHAPLATHLLGRFDNTSSSAVATKLSKKLKKHVYVSYNLPSDDTFLKAQVEKRVLEEISVHPERF